MFIVDTGRTQQRVNNFLRVALKEGGGRQERLVEGEAPELVQWLMHAPQALLDRVWSVSHRGGVFSSFGLSNVLGGYWDLDGHAMDRSDPAFGIPLWQRPINAPTQQDLRTIGRAYQDHAVRQSQVVSAVLAVHPFHREQVLREYDETVQTIAQIKQAAERQFGAGRYALIRAHYDRATGHTTVQDIR